jgi:hypothetical protein
MREPRIISRFREISLERKGEFMSQGLKGRYFFPHRAYYLPKLGPDGLKMSERMCGIEAPNASWEVVLYATGPRAAEFPEDLYFDDEVVWHRQQFGKAGQVATANLVVSGKDLYCNNYLSDLVQRISRRREHKTRIENHFREWPWMLLNAILNFAMEQQLDFILSPTADFVLKHVPADRHVNRQLFDRIYDRTVMNRYHAVRKGNWWVIDVRVNRERLVVPTKGEEELANNRTICICHDIERGFGHIGIDGDRVQVANRIAPGALMEMVQIEESTGVKATYNILGCFFDEVREEIARSGHCLAFHSYDHQIHKGWWLTKHSYRAMRLLAHLLGADTDGKYQSQLQMCRLVDYRVKGFRPPRSRMTAEWNDYELAFHNFEWFATSAYQLGVTRPMMQNRLVKIPIHFDDFPLYKQGVAFGDWEKKAMASIEQNAFIAFGLHDCYAELWLPRYREFLPKIAGLGAFKTLDQVANETILANAI